MLEENVHLLSRLRSNIDLFDLPVAPRPKRRGRPAEYGNNISVTSPTWLHNTAIWPTHTMSISAAGPAKSWPSSGWSCSKPQALCTRRLDLPKNPMGRFVNHGSVPLGRTNRGVLWSPMEDRGRIQGDQARDQKRSDPVQKSSSRGKPSQPLYDGHFGLLDLCHATQDSETQTCCETSRNHYAFSNVRRDIAETGISDDFCTICSYERKSIVNSVVASLLRMAA